MLSLLLAASLFSLDGTNQIDLDTVKRMGNVVSVRMVTSGIKSEKDPRIANVLSDIELDCTAHKARIFATYFFDDKFKLLSKNPPHDSTATAYTEDSVFALIEDRLCSNPQAKPGAAVASTPLVTKPAN
ncbi:surface-adhesin E family protein [Silvimonas amylolytica]|uniref:Surface-adhesin protein E-like domain-containing protein n=1 Tax=Silvimonas amylolytica TaxID=449663 RepID=A0ABQ2PNJ8_9NEIS|nr:surface-adhesin E family protein [Silvimonas amylolytica]GGP26883.1 hypothetical protein GCM10010971_27020 [Silvimonas amylolytica]